MYVRELIDLTLDASTAAASPTSPPVGTMTIHFIFLYVALFGLAFSIITILYHMLFIQRQQVTVALGLFFISTIAWLFACATQIQQDFTFHTDGINTSMAVTECVYLLLFCQFFLMFWLKQFKGFDKEICQTSRRNPGNCCFPCTIAGAAALVLWVFLGSYAFVLLFIYHWPFNSPVSARSMSVTTLFATSLILIITMFATNFKFCKKEQENAPAFKTQESSVDCMCCCWLCASGRFRNLLDSALCQCFRCSGFFVDPSQCFAFLGVLFIFVQSIYLLVIPVTENYPTVFLTSRLFFVFGICLCSVFVTLIWISQFRDYNRVETEDAEQKLIDKTVVGSKEYLEGKEATHSIGTEEEEESEDADRKESDLVDSVKTDLENQSEEFNSESVTVIEVAESKVTATKLKAKAIPPPVETAEVEVDRKEEAEELTGNEQDILNLLAPSSSDAQDKTE